MGDPGAALAEVFVKVDDLMMQPESAAELLALRDGSWVGEQIAVNDHCKAPHATHAALLLRSPACLCRNTCAVDSCVHVASLRPDFQHGTMGRNCHRTAVLRYPGVGDEPSAAQKGKGRAGVSGWPGPQVIPRRHSASNPTDLAGAAVAA